MRLAARTDAIQTEVVLGLRRFGYSVQCLHTVGKGCPDLLVGKARQNWLIELKSPGGRLTRDELEWITKWQGQVAIAHSLEEALAAIGVKDETT